MRDIRLGRAAGLELAAAPSAAVGSALLWLLLSGLGVAGLRLPPGAAIAGGLAAVALHWAGEFVHQAGHAWAARRTGHPMSGVRLWALLSTSVYPAGEGDLPARVHVRRALGGPALSLVVGLLLSLAAAALYPLGGLARYLSLFAALDNVLVFALGSLLPLPFTDGGTLRQWWARS